MPKSVLSRKRSWIARFAILAMIASLMAIAVPASAHSVAISTSGSCPSTIPDGGFTDISGHTAETQHAINCIKHYGITTGTSATTYSPNEPVARWQMALFLIRQAQDHGIVLPDGSPQGFTDIGTLNAETQTAINQLAQLDITKGTSTTTFSPFRTVTRWQMALFLYRLSLRAGVSFTDDPLHNQFNDISTLSAETQTAINALADAHIALGIGLSRFDPTADVLRWQMALFLTRVLAADGVVPLGLRVSVTPTDTATLSLGQFRTYTATFTNADGTPYTGVIGVQLVDTTSGGAPIYNDTSFATGATVAITSVTDGLAGVSTAEVNGSAGTDGKVTFTIRVTGAAEQVVPVAWQDLDGDFSYETAGNVAPTEPFGLGGVSNYVAVAAVEADAGTYTVGVTKTTKASDTFEASATGVNCGNGSGTACSFNYDANDAFTVDGAAATLTDFEAALSQNDTVTVTYDPDEADQSTFNLTDNVADLTVTTPSAATTVDADFFTIKGKADPSATIRVKSGATTIGTGTADADGAWSVTVPLTQSAANNFTVTQQPVGGVQSAAVAVPTITESTSAGAKLTSTVAAEGGAAETGLGPGDTITITFSEALSAVSNGDTIGLQDSDGTVATLTLGADVSFALSSGDTVLTLTINVAIPGSGGTTGGIDGSTNITSIGGFTDDDGEAIDVAGSGAGRTFDAP